MLEGEEEGLMKAILSGKQALLLNTAKPQIYTLIISVRWDSGSRPAIGKMRIFWVFEHLSASERVIFLCVALSVEWGLL